ncbi:unnamed protein product [Polarella glacialis]|uniref:Uncharacterized protein n=1 Tax=Polarella glacialis TaxID=89957 RepID=A0A813LRC8_POLGL|nr:unnamed protein product [Polarella glacialis]
MPSSSVERVSAAGGSRCVMPRAGLPRFGQRTLKENLNGCGFRRLLEETCPGSADPLAWVACCNCRAHGVRKAVAWHVRSHANGLSRSYMLAACLLSHRSAWCTKLRAPRCSGGSHPYAARGTKHHLGFGISTAQRLHGHSFGNSGNKPAGQPMGKEPRSTNNHLLHLRADVCNPMPQQSRSQNSPYSAKFGARLTGGLGEQEKLENRACCAVHRDLAAVSQKLKTGLLRSRKDSARLKLVTGIRLSASRRCNVPFASLLWAAVFF